MTPLRLGSPIDPLSLPFDSMRRLIDEMAGSGFVRFAHRDAWKPALNLYENDVQFMVCVDLAGMPREQIDVQAEPNRIIIMGRRDDPQPSPSAEPFCVHIMEIDSGAFTRTVEFRSPIDVNNVTAAYRDGLLWITIPKQRSEPHDATP